MTKTLRLLASYRTQPIFDIGEEYGPVDLADLPISRRLSDEIASWDAAYQLTFNDDYPPDSAFPNAGDKKLHKEEGLRLAHALQRELGEGYLIRYGV